MAKFKERITSKQQKQLEQDLINAGYVFEYKTPPQQLGYRKSLKPRIDYARIAKEIGRSSFTLSSRLTQEVYLLVMELLKNKLK